MGELGIVGRLARIVVYAVLACGASFACLLLFAGPAQADDSGPGLSLISGGSSEDDGPAESVGRLVGELGRSSADTTTDLVGDVVAVAPVVKPVVQPVADKATEVVEHTTDAVVSEVEKATAEVDGGVSEALAPRPATSPGGAPPPQQPAGEDPSVGAPPGEPSADTPSGEPSVDEPRTQDSPREAATRDGSDERSPADAPQRSERHRASAPDTSLDVGASGLSRGDVQDLTLGSATADDSADTSDASAVQATGPWGTPAACDNCAAGTSGSSGDLPTLHGLVGSNLLTSPGLTAPGIVRAELGPAVTFSTPDESPD